MRDNFACFILCHGRPENTPTYDTLRKFGYTGKIYIICDDEDKTLPGYIERYGKDSVKIFNKLEVLKNFDTMDTSDNRACAVYARNACFTIARELGLKYFCELDDDYYNIRFRINKDGKLITRYTYDMDSVFESYLEFLDCSPHIYSIAFSQTGDYIGGCNSNLARHQWLHKCMNSWICDVDKAFTFNGRMNDDVNTYTLGGSRGLMYFTLTGLCIDQPNTQQVSGGMTEMYKGEGTYQKSFYTVMQCPSFVSIDVMGDKYYRIHHHIDSKKGYPKIISGVYKK